MVIRCSTMHFVEKCFLFEFMYLATQNNPSYRIFFYSNKTVPNLEPFGTENYGTVRCEYEKDRHEGLFCVFKYMNWKRKHFFTNAWSINVLTLKMMKRPIFH